MRRPSPTSAKRWTVKLALCLLAGAAVTWGVAWGCALWAPYTARSHPAGAWPEQVPSDWPPPFSETSGRGPGYFSYRWENALGKRQYTIFYFRFGWPALALGSTVRSGEKGPDRIGVLRLSDPAAHPNIAGLPTRILPLGFALNTLFYAAVLLGVVECVAFARRRVRRGKNRCPSCGYDRAGLAEGSACPECGS